MTIGEGYRHESESKTHRSHRQGPARRCGKGVGNSDHKKNAILLLFSVSLGLVFANAPSRAAAYGPPCQRSKSWSRKGTHFLQILLAQKLTGHLHTVSEGYRDLVHRPPNHLVTATPTTVDHCRPMLRQAARPVYDMENVENAH